MRSLKRRGRGRGEERAGHGGVKTGGTGSSTGAEGCGGKHGGGGSEDCINGGDTGEIWGRYEADEAGDSISISSTASGGSWVLAEQRVTDQSTGNSRRVHDSVRRVHDGGGRRVHDPGGECSRADEAGDSISISSTASGGSWMLAEQRVTDQSTGNSGRVHDSGRRVHDPPPGGGRRVHDSGGECSRSLQEQSKNSTSTRSVTERSGDRSESGSVPAVLSPRWSSCLLRVSSSRQRSSKACARKSLLPGLLPYSLRRRGGGDGTRSRRRGRNVRCRSRLLCSPRASNRAVALALTSA